MPKRTKGSTHTRSNTASLDGRNTSDVLAETIVPPPVAPEFCAEHVPDVP